MNVLGVYLPMKDTQRETGKQGVVIFRERQFGFLFSRWERKAICFVWRFDPVPTSKLQRWYVFFTLLFIVVSSRLSLSMFSGLQSCTGALFRLKIQRVRIISVYANCI